MIDLVRESFYLRISGFAVVIC